MAEGAERRTLISVPRVLDDTLAEFGLPGPFDLLPSPSELIHAAGLPTLDDLAESGKAQIANTVTSQAGPGSLISSLRESLPLPKIGA